MKRVIARLALAAAVIVAVFVAVVALQPGDFRVTRSTTIAAPPPDVFALVNDFRRWEAWSPWEHRDPAMRRSFDGPPAGTGSSYAWAGNHEVGEGRMTVVESRPDALVRIRLEFLQPFAATNTADFTFTPEAGQTAVTWSMYGRQSFVAKAFGLFVSMDRLVGGDFENGLARMKSVAESRAAS